MMNAAVSDLFFNFEHQAYDALMRARQPDAKGRRRVEAASPDEIEAALRADAAEFAVLVEDAFGINLDTDALAADCQRRI